MAEVAEASDIQCFNSQSDVLSWRAKANRATQNFVLE